MKKLLSMFIVLSFLSMLAACTTQSQNGYSADEVGKQSDIELGKILSMKKVKVQPQTTGVGAGTGIAGGAVAGANMGNGNGSVAAAIAGAIVGGIAGAAAEKAVSEQEGIQYVIRKDNGKVVSIVQNIADDDAPLHVGQRVMIQTSGEYQKSSRGGAGNQFQRVLPMDDGVDVPVKK